jgi:hypothetical protein
MVVITHGEPRHQHAWLPLHKPPTHGKDLALLLMGWGESEMAAAIPNMLNQRDQGLDRFI